MDTDFSTDGDKIRLPITEVLLRASVDELARSKNQRDWTPRNAVLLPTFLTEAAILNGGYDAGKLLKIFARSVTEWVKEGEDTSKDDDGEDNKSEVGVEAEEENITNNGKTKQDTSDMLATIADNCENVLAFLQAVTVKSPRVTTAPLSLHATKRVCVWFHQWKETNLPIPPKLSPQDHMGLTGVLTDVDTRLQTVEALLPVVVAQHEA